MLLAEPPELLVEPVEPFDELAALFEPAALLEAVLDLPGAVVEVLPESSVLVARTNPVRPLSLKE